MEVSLTHPDVTASQVTVTCDGQVSHTFDLSALVPTKANGLSHPKKDPIAYGKALYQALFPPDSSARQALDLQPERIVLIAADADLDAIPWEYAYGPDGFLVCDYPFVRGLPTGQRISPPTFSSNLHIVAVPTNPLSADLAPLNIEGEWMRLKEIIESLENAVTLERVWPPTIERLRAQVANQQQRVVHFMGHGGQIEQIGAVLCFERDNGSLENITAREFVKRVRGGAFLVTLNACESAEPGETLFSNLAAALVREKIPYALGMRSSIHDDDALAFSRTFYNDLACGTPVEEALLQARLTLAKSVYPRAVGIPVLYTSLDLTSAKPGSGFAVASGVPVVIDQRERRRDRIDVLPRVEGIFQGRIKEQLKLGTWLTGDNRQRMITIHGSGGQGKTALARVAADRFAHAWPGGVWAITLENLPSRAIFVADVARFLDIDVQALPDAADLEREVSRRLRQRRTLLLLDNAETLVAAAQAQDAEAIHLAQFIQQLPDEHVSLLVTSQRLLGWSGEQSLELGGLKLHDGVLLFRQSAPQRTDAFDPEPARRLSVLIDHHPLALLLLGKDFNSSAISLAAFVADYKAHLFNAENTYQDVDHRHRKLYATFEKSIRDLSPDLQRLYSNLWLFHAPFLPETAVAIFDPEFDKEASDHSPIEDHLYALWQRSLLAREGTGEDGLLLYRVPPIMRPFIEHYLADKSERDALLARFGAAYANLARYLSDELDRGGVTAYLALQCREDLDRGIEQVTGIEQGYYLLHWGWVLQRLGDRTRGLSLTEQALENAQERDQELTLWAMNNIAVVYRVTGQPQAALRLYEQALPILKEVGNRAVEATTLNNMGEVYRATGQSQAALRLYEQALPITREVGDRAVEATTLNNMGLVYHATGQPQAALRLFEQALPITREVGDRAVEATTLNNMGAVYHATGQPQAALRLYEQALPILREVGDRTMEATTLNNMGEVYRVTGQPQAALRLYEQALPILREVGDRTMEATTLNSMGLVYRATGQPQAALRLYEQALPILKEVGNRAGEATTLNNMGLVYHATGQPQEALRLYEQALPILREVGDRTMEATTLNNMGRVYYATGQSQEALPYYEQALPIMREVSNRAGEAATLVNIAVLLYQKMQRPQEAIANLEQALAIMHATGLPQDAAGQTSEIIEGVLQEMREGTFASGQAEKVAMIPAEQINIIVGVTIEVMTTMPEQRAEWRKAVAQAVQNAQQGGPDWQILVEFLTAILAILDGEPPSLAADHPYAQVLTAIQDGIARGGTEME